MEEETCLKVAPLLTTDQFKSLCIRRSLASVVTGVCMQFVLLYIFIVVAYMHILHPVNWVTDTFAAVTTLRTWVAVLPLAHVAILNGVLLNRILARKEKYFPTRFKWLIGTAPYKLLYLGIHLLLAYFAGALYASFMGDLYSNLVHEHEGVNCINSRYTFTVCASIAAGCYHFFKEHLVREPEIHFPIIRQNKALSIRYCVTSTIYGALVQTLPLVLGYSVAYWLLEGIINGYVADVLSADVDNTLTSIFSIACNVRLILCTWLICGLVLTNLQLMEHLFSIFLTDPITFIIQRNPIASSDAPALTLAEALSITHLPLIRKLAALDFYTISVQKTERRQQIFALSIPGGHPYNWLQISGQCLNIINEFCREFENSLQTLSITKSKTFATFANPFAPDNSERLLIRQYNTNVGIRRIQMEELDKKPPPISNVPNIRAITDPLQNLRLKIKKALQTALFAIPGYVYFFQELEGAKTAFLLSKAQIVMWVVQGLSGICVASLKEDNYGVVQVTLRDVLKAILTLKLELDKFSTICLNTKCINRDFVALKWTVKQSLYRICNAFRDYLGDIIEDPTDLENLNYFLLQMEKN